MENVIITLIVGLIGLASGYIITQKTKIDNILKSKLDNETYELIKSVCKDFCQYANDKLDLENRKDYVNSKVVDFAKDNLNLDITEEMVDKIRHAVIEEAKQVIND